MKKKDLQQLLGSLVEKDKQSQFIIANPDAIEDLVKQGAQPRKVPELSLEESIDRLLSDRKETILELGEKLPDPLRRLALPAIESLYNEISECILFRLNGAAITLSGVLVEFALKYFTFICEIGGFAEYDAKKWDKFENIGLDSAITRAYKAGLLTDEDKEQLISFKDQIRNPYSHYNIRKITERVDWKKVEIRNLKTGEVEERDIAAKDNPIIQAAAEPFVDKEQVFRVFRFADYMVRLLFSRIDGLV